MSHLSYKLFRATGTARENRLLKCPFPDNKTIDRADRDTYWSRSDGDVSAVKWKDNKPVPIVTNFDPIEPLHQCTRWSKEQKKRVAIPQPQIIRAYNTFMGGVDILDQAISDCRPTISWKKWDGPLIVNCFSVLRVAAAWRVHRSLGEKLD
ncbi:UNVERIFIED_CONTAM: hypothetical protein RMT77_010757 [Armadillidium vulgare]